MGSRPLMEPTQLPQKPTNMRPINTGKRLSVTLATGQSNLVRGSASPHEFDYRDNHIWYWGYYGTWDALAYAPESWTDVANAVAAANASGVAEAAIRRINYFVEPEKTHALIEIGYNGNPIQALYPDGSGYNERGIAARDQVDMAIAAAEAEGYEVSVDRMLILGHTRNATDEDTQAAMLARIQGYAAFWRGRYNPLSQIVVSDWPPSFSTKVGAPAIRAAFAEFASLDDKASLVNTDGFNSDDDVHLDNPSLELWGQRIAEAVIDFNP